jgi:hypothetical protein
MNEGEIPIQPPGATWRAVKASILTDGRTCGNDPDGPWTCPFNVENEYCDLFGQDLATETYFLDEGQPFPQAAVRLAECQSMELPPGSYTLTPRRDENDESE